MHSKLPVTLLCIGCFACLLMLFPAFDHPRPAADPETNYATYCAGCHGEQMQAFVDRRWVHGNTDADLYKAIEVGYPEDGMPGFEATFTQAEIQELVAYIQEGIKDRARYDFDAEVNLSQVYQAERFSYQLELLEDGVQIPWGMASLPDGGFLLTDKLGTLYRKTAEGELRVVSGSPRVVARGQGGLLDVVLHPNFTDNRLVYLSYSKPHPTRGTRLRTTAVLRGRLEDNQLLDTSDIFVALPYESTAHHYGSRMAFDRNGFLYVSVGDRGRRDRNPQRLDNHCGKVHRLHDDGSIPNDNPFVGQPNAVPSIYSYGHRNIQGLAVHPETGAIWTHEHGPRGGDELNVVEPGKNYGWPTISYGINYNGTTFTNRTEAPGLEQPLHYWVPSIAPCGMAFVTGNRYPGWEADLMIGSLRFKYLNHCVLDGESVTEEDLLLPNIGRLRNVYSGPDGFLYVATEEPGRIYRLRPVGS